MNNNKVGPGLLANLHQQTTYKWYTQQGSVPVHKLPTTLLYIHTLEHILLRGKMS